MVMRASGFERKIEKATASGRKVGSTNTSRPRPLQARSCCRRPEAIANPRRTITTSTCRLIQSFGALCLALVDGLDVSDSRMQMRILATMRAEPKAVGHSEEPQDRRALA